MRRCILLLAGLFALSGCGLTTLFTGVAEGPAGRTNAGAGLASWQHTADNRCPDGSFQGAVNAASFSGTCEFGPDGSRKESFNLVGADSGSIIAAVLAAQTQQNKDSAAALNQALGVLGSLAISGATSGLIRPTPPAIPPTPAVQPPAVPAAPPAATGLRSGAAFSPSLGQPQ